MGLLNFAGDEFSARGHVDTVNVGKAHGGRRGGEKHLARARFARHGHDFAAGGAAHDRVVHQQHIFTLPGSTRLL